jgi:hypothetical protein
VIEFLLDLEFHHKRQTLGMEGPNLAEKRCRQILMRASETPLTKIRKIDDLHFEAQSSKSLKSYQINLNTITCNCSNFPHIQLCKHIAAVVHFFKGADLRPQPPASDLVMPNSPVQQSSSISSTDDGAIASIVSAANDIISLSYELISKAPHDRELQNCSIQFNLSSVPLCSRQQCLAMVPTSQKKKLLDPINGLGRRWPCGWG